MKTLTLLLAAVMLLALAVGCSTGNSNTSSYPPPQSYPPDQTYPQSGQNYPSGPTVASTGGNGVIPAGTQLAIRTNERIDARDGTSTGRDYDAEVANDIVNDRGEVLVPRGSDAKLTVLRSDKNDLVLGVRELEVRGRKETYCREGAGGGSCVHSACNIAFDDSCLAGEAQLGTGISGVRLRFA